MANEILTIEGKKYLKVGDKAVLIDHFDENGKPVIKAAYSEELTNPDGSKNCIIHMPCFQLVTSSKLK